MRGKRVFPLIGVAIVFLWLLLDATADEGHKHETSAVSAHTEIIQKTCPVMVGNKIDPNIFSEYQGKKVYFCCESCKANFDAAPEKYLARLPQFSTDEKEAHVTQVEAAEHEGHVHEEPESRSLSFPWGRLIVPMGITTFSLLVLTFLAGWFMAKKRKLLFRWHRRLAIATLVSATIHALLVILFH